MSTATTFTTSRTFPATPAAVFAAFAAPERLAAWWGPDGFSSTIDTFEFGPGGAWRFTMHGPDGADYPNQAVFLAVEPARTIIIKHTTTPHFTLTIRLTGTASGTLVTWEQAFDDAMVAQAVRHIVVPANEQNLSRWQAAVASSTATGTP